VAGFSVGDVSDSALDVTFMVTGNPLETRLGSARGIMSTGIFGIFGTVTPRPSQFRPIAPETRINPEPL